MKLFTRGGIAAIAIAAAAFIAAGCGGSGGSGASSAAKDSKALDYVPKTAIAYVTLDTDLEGDSWKQFNELATAFDGDFKGVVEELEAEGDDSAEDEDSKEDDLDYKKDVDPWLGESAGAALLSVEGEGDDADFFMWAELEDQDKFEAFAKDQDWKAGKEIGDFKTYSDPDDETNHVAYSDDLILLAPSRKQLEARVEFDGDSITDAKGVGDAVDETGDDALATVVLSGEGVRKLIKDTPDLKPLAANKQLEDFHAAAFSLAAEDSGMRLEGFVAADGEDSAKNTEHPIFEDLPADTILAIGASKFGSSVNEAVTQLGEDDPSIQQGVGAAEAALGVELEELADVLDGEFVLGMSADDAGLASIVGSAAGAAMGGGSSPDVQSLLSSGSFVLAFEETGKTSETLDKVMAAAAPLAGVTTAPKEEKLGDFAVKQLDIQGMPLSLASTDEIAALQIGKDVFSTWGDESLGESEAYADAWKAADGPGETAGLFWLDAGRIAKLAQVESGDEREVGGLVGWVEADGSNAKFDLFLHIPEA